MRKKILWGISGVLICCALYIGIIFIRLIIKDMSRKPGKGMSYISEEASLKIDEPKSLITLDLSKNLRTDYFDSIDSLCIIAPETTDESLIGGISDLAIVNDTLFIVDAWKAKAIFAYDMSGKFLYKIEKPGKGPGEYLSINAIQFTKDQIILLDWLSWKLIRYDLKGNLLSEKTISGGASYFALPDNGQVAFVSQRNKDYSCRLRLTDTTFKEIQTAFPFKNTRDLGANQPIVTGNKILFYYPLCDTVYEIEKNHIRPKYCLSFYPPGEVDEFIGLHKDLDDNSFLKKLATSKLVDSYSILNLDDYLFVHWQRDPQWLHSIVRKTDGKSVNFIAGNSEEKKLYTLPCAILGSYQNKLLGYTDGSIHSRVPKEYMKEFYKLLSNQDIKRVEDLKDSDNNPVVFLISIKQF